MKTRCKFKCVNYGMSGDQETFQAKFEAVVDGSKENETFFKYTPSGSLELQVLNDHKFEIGKDYYLDISEVPEES